jgi:pyrroloquinoline-quinone synthase
LKEAPEDVEFGLDYVLGHADTREKQDDAAAALTFKTDVLWSQLDALHFAYVSPGLIPPGAWNGIDHLATGADDAAGGHERA